MSIRDVKQIKIMIESNVSKKPKELTLSQIFNSFATEDNNEKKKKKKDEENKDGENKDGENKDEEKYPYFIENIPYPEDVLKTKPYSTILKIFFNKKSFYETIVKPYTGIKKPDVKLIEKNITIMLNLIFPTSYPATNNINTSYRKYIAKIPFEFKFDLGEIKNVIPGFTNNSKAEYSYLLIDGEKYTITEILWLNDAFNQPEYKDFIDKLIKYNAWVDDIKIDISTEQDEYITKLIKGLQKNVGAATAAPATASPPSDTDISKLRINNEEIYLIERRKKMFLDQYFNDELANIYNYFISDSTTEKDDILVNLKKNFQNKTTLNFETFRNNVLNPSKGSNPFHDIRSIKFQNIADLNNTNIDTMIDKINIKKLNGDMTNVLPPASYNKNDLVNKLLAFLFKPYYKYKTSMKISENAKLYNEQIKYDENITDLIENIKKLNSIDFDADIELKSEGLYKKITEATNIIENIQKLFGKVEFYKSTEYTKLTNKINQMLLFSTEIHKYDIVNQYILQKDKGICINYKKLIENENDQKILSEELKNTKYSQYNEIITTITEFYNYRKTMNPDLQQLMDDYFNCNNAKFEKEIIAAIEKLENNEKPTADLDKLNVSATLCIDKNNKSSKYYEIFVYMELLKDVMNSSSSVSCSFLDEKITDMFKQLTSYNDNTYYADKSDKVFKVTDVTKKTTNEMSESSSNNTGPLKKNTEQVEPKTGGNYHLTRKIKPNKKLRKTKRHRSRYLYF